MIQSNSPHSASGAVSSGMVSDLDRRPGPPWWMVPHLLVLALMVPLLTVAWLVPVEFHWDLGRPAKYLDFDAYVLGIAAVASFALGSFLASRGRIASGGLDLERAAASPALNRLFRNACWVLFGIAVAAYVIWFLPVARDPSILVDVLAGRWFERDIRDTVGTIPGLTTLVQAQVVYVTLLAVRWLYLPELRPSRMEKLGLLVIILLSILRNLIWSERIAMIEALVPVIVLFLRRPRWPTLTALAPVFGLACLFAFFAVFEYFRSWVAYYRFHYDSFLVFILARLSGYYITALDNGAGLVHEWSGLAGPLNTADWFWRLPWEIGQTSLLKALGLDALDSSAWLYWNASPEFNNTSGIYMPFLDYGAAGGIVFWFLGGMLTGMLFRRFACGRISGMLIYPSWFVGLLELPRILYLCEARYFPVIVIALAFIFIANVVAAGEERAVPQKRLL